MPASLSEEAARLHAEAVVIDLHADTLSAARMIKYDMAERHENRVPRSPYFYHCDLPRFREGGVDGQVFGLVAFPYPEYGCLDAALEQIECLDELIRRHPDQISACRNGDEIREARRTGRFAGLLGVEGAHLIEGSLDNVGLLARRGVASFGLAHFSRNRACSPSAGMGTSDEARLSRFGRDLVQEVSRQGMLLDVAHMGRAGFIQACKQSDKPVLVSHTGVAGARKHWRNIDDEQLRAVAATGGVVGVIFSSRYLEGPQAGIEAVARHMEHIRATVGGAHVALGSDYDGLIVPVKGLEDVSRLPGLTQVLLERGWDPEEVLGALGGNALRAFDALGPTCD